MKSDLYMKSGLYEERLIYVKSFAGQDAGGGIV
jgi:hypothetical protein